MNFYNFTCGLFAAAYLGYFLYWLKDLSYTLDFPYYGLSEGNPLVRDKYKQLSVWKAAAVFAAALAFTGFGQLIAPRIWESSRATFQFFFVWPLAMVLIYRFYMIPRHIARRAEQRAKQLRAVEAIRNSPPDRDPVLVVRSAGGLRGRGDRAFASWFPWLYVNYSGDLVGAAPEIAAKLRKFVADGATFPA